MTRAGVYGRNSHANEKSIDDQLDIGVEAVAGQGWKLAGKYSDGTSASRFRTKERGNWARLMSDLDAGELDVLVLWKPARGSRDANQWLDLLDVCRKQGTLIHVIAHRRTYDPQNVAADWETLAVEGVKSAGYSDQLSEDVSRGTRKAAEKGYPHGRVAFGYSATHEPDPERPGRIRPGRIPNEHVPTVREIFERLDKHVPLNELTKDFRARNIPSPSGKPWQRNTIRTIATNISYIGKRLHDGQTHDAQWAPIVDETLFWRVQALLTTPERKTTKPGKAKYLLSYIAHSPCGAHLHRRPGKPGAPERLGCVDDGCVSIVMHDADTVIERAILGRLAQPDARDMFLRNDVAAAQARADAARLRVQLDEARRSFARPDGISAEALAMKERALIPLIEDADRRAKPSGSAGTVEMLVSADNISAVWAGLGVAARRSVVGLVVEVVLGPPTRRLGQAAAPEARLEQALERLSGSRWVGDTRTWGEIWAAEGI